MSRVGDIGMRVLASTSRMLRPSRGQGLVEYALILGLVSLAATSALPTVGQELAGVFDTVSQTLTNSNADHSTPDPKPGNPDPGPPDGPKPGNPNPGPSGESNPAPPG